MPLAWDEASRLRLLMAVIMSTKENTTYDWNKIAEMLENSVTASAARQQFQKIKNGLGKQLSDTATSTDKSPPKTGTPRKRKNKVAQDDVDQNDDEVSGSPKKKTDTKAKSKVKQEASVKREESPEHFDREQTIGHVQASDVIDAEDPDNV